MLGSTNDSTYQRVTPSERDRPILNTLAAPKSSLPKGSASPGKRSQRSQNREVKNEQSGEFKEQLGDFAKLLIESEQQQKSPFMKSGGYKKVREEIERLDKVINKRKGIVTHEHTEEKLGRSAARQKI